MRLKGHIDGIHGLTLIYALTEPLDGSKTVKGIGLRFPYLYLILSL
jgi:hypothetical protein